MGGKGDAPPPPDYGPLAAASQASAEYAYKLGKEQLDWAKQQYADNKDVSDTFIETALGQMDRQADWATRDRARYEAIFQPLEEQLAADADTYNTEGRREYEAGKAEADVAQQFDQARNAAQARLEQFGIDPSQTRAGALDLQTRIAEAATQSAAGNAARERVENTGRALRSEAINVGKGYPAQALGANAQATAAGQAGVNSGLATTASGAQTMGTAPQWQGLGNQAVNMWGNILHTGYQDQLDAFKAEQQGSSGIGSALGLVGGIASKFIGMAEGGQVPAGAGVIPVDQTGGDARTPGGGPITPSMSPSRGGVIDDVPAAVSDGGTAMLNAGEFVIPKDVMQWRGEAWAQKEILKARKEMSGEDGKRPAQPTRGPAPPGQGAGVIPT